MHHCGISRRCREHPLDADAGLREAGHGQLDRPRRARAALIGDGHDDGVAAGVVDEDLEMVVASHAPVLRRAAATEDPPAAPVGHPPQLLVVLVDEGARMAGHGTHNLGGEPEDAVKMFPSNTIVSPPSPSIESDKITGRLQGDTFTGRGQRRVQSLTSTVR